jgi:hypothetical protein
MSMYSLTQPEDYYVVEYGSAYAVLFRPDDTEVARFEKTLGWECEMRIAAFEDHFEDHSERLVAPLTEHSPRRRSAFIHPIT